MYVFRSLSYHIHCPWSNLYSAGIDSDVCRRQILTTQVVVNFLLWENYLNLWHVFSKHPIIYNLIKSCLKIFQYFSGFVLSFICLTKLFCYFRKYVFNCMLYFLIVAYIGILFLDFIQKHYASFARVIIWHALCESLRTGDLLQPLKCWDSFV